MPETVPVTTIVLGIYPANVQGFFLVFVLETVPGTGMLIDPMTAPSGGRTTPHPESALWIAPPARAPGTHVRTFPENLIGNVPGIVPGNIPGIVIRVLIVPGLVLGSPIHDPAIERPNIAVAGAAGAAVDILVNGIVTE